MGTFFSMAMVSCVEAAVCSATYRQILVELFCLHVSLFLFFRLAFFSPSKKNLAFCFLFYLF